MNSALVKLIDISLLPAALMVIGKFFGLLLVITLFNLPWQFNDISAGVFALSPALLPQDLVIASTYSDVIMYVIMAAGFSFILLQATHFHDTHIKPRTLIKLSNHNLMGLVRSSFDLYHAAAMWLIFLWMSTMLIWLNVITLKTELWVGIVVGVGSVIFTTLMLQDVYKEIEISRRNIGNQEALT